MKIDLYNGDCLEVMKKIPDNSIDLVVTSPPYNKGFWSRNRNINNGFKTKCRHIQYGDFDDNLSAEEYDKQQRKVIEECIRVLKDDGSIFYNHIDILHRHQTIHPLFVYEYPLKQIIIWNRRNSPKLDKSYFVPVNEWIFWLQKNKKSRTKFDRNKSIFKTNVWNISPATNNCFVAPFPIEIPLNLINSTTTEGDVVLDPFMGSGTTGVACKQLNRNFIGIELVKDYYDMAKERIEDVLL